MPKYIIKNIQTSSDDYDKEGSDEENLSKKISVRKILVNKMKLWFYSKRKNAF